MTEDKIKIAQKYHLIKDDANDQDLRVYGLNMADAFRLMDEYSEAISKDRDYYKELAEKLRLKYQNEGLKLENSELESELSKAKEDKPQFVKHLEKIIARAYQAEQNGGAEEYPFDSMTLENIVGMRRAYSHILRILGVPNNSTVKPEQTEEQIVNPPQN